MAKLGHIKGNRIEVHGDYAILFASNNQEPIYCDLDDLTFLRQFTWCAVCRKGKQTVYAWTTVKDETGKRRSTRMHRLLMPEIEQIDHEDGNGLNNRRTNLRQATTSENCRNRSLPSTNSSGYRGVSWHKGSRSWSVGIKIHQKRIHLGHFRDPSEGARAYDRAAIQYHGDFASLNFPPVTL